MNEIHSTNGYEKHSSLILKVYCFIILCVCCSWSTVWAQNNSVYHKKIDYPKPNQQQRKLITQLQLCKTHQKLVCIEKAKGVIYKVNIPPCDTCRTLFLTFDACISGFDTHLIQFLIDHQIKSTLFVTAQWILNQPNAVKLLKEHLDLFDIQNHGTLHRPASLCGCKVYGIEGTHNPQELVAEIMTGDSVIRQTFGCKLLFFRSGTAFYDQESACSIELMGYKIMGYSVAADAGASFPAEVITQQILHARHGDILLMHFNAKGNNVYSGFVNAYETIVKKEYCVNFDRLSNFISYCTTY